MCVSKSPRDAIEADVYLPSSEDIDGLASEVRNAAGDSELIGVYTLAENSKFRQLHLSRALGLPADRPETVLGGRDKRTMRGLLQQSGLANHDWYFVPDSDVTEAARLPYPLVCKPNMGFASGGVRVVRNDSEYARAVAGIRRLNLHLLRARSPVETGTIVEEFLSGPEYSLDAITWNGATRLFATCGKKYPEGNTLIDYAYWSPAVPELAEAFGQVARRCAQALRYEFGPSHTEVRWDDRRKCWQVLETALRVGFGGHIGSMIRATTGVDYNGLALLSALRQPAAADDFHQPGDSRGLGVVFSPEIRGRGKFRGIKGIDAIRRNPRVHSVDILPEVGQWISVDSFDYALILVAVLESPAELDTFLAEISEQAEVEFL
jgi:biotin carboxylase